MRAGPERLPAIHVQALHIGSELPRLWPDEPWRRSTRSHRLKLRRTGRDIPATYTAVNAPAWLVERSSAPIQPFSEISPMPFRRADGCHVRHLRCRSWCVTLRGSPRHREPAMDAVGEFCMDALEFPS
jgi:hypothetical protein